MNKKIKITWVTIFPHPIYTFILNSLGKQSNLDLTEVILSENVKKQDSMKRSFKTIPTNVLMPFGLKNLRYIKNIKKVLHKENPDKIILNLYISLYSIQVYLFAKRQNKDLILVSEFRNPDRKVKKILFSIWNFIIGKKIINYSKRVLTWSKDSQKFMQDITADKSKVKYLQPGIDTNLFYSKSSDEIRLNEPMQLLMVARFIPVKNHAVLIKALTKILSENNNIDITVTFLGGGQLRDEIENKVKKLDLSDKVKFLDRVPYEKIREIYNEHDVLVLPSKKEAVGMVVPEAMACGTPVIVSDSVGAKDYVVEGQNGFVFKTGDHEELAEKILRMSKMDLNKMGKHAANHIRENYEAGEVADRFYNIITKD
ncbi:MAG: glycosyltransferase family 4 protein [Candidatus Paceibacterota bacterium]